MRYNITGIALTMLLLCSIKCIAQESYLDGSFGTNGISLTLPFIPSMMAVQEDQKILVTGSAAAGSTTKLYRFNTNGTLDQSFGTGGSAPAGNATAYTGVRQLDDGKILIAGTRTQGAMGYFTGTIVFAQFNTDGTPDTSFGTNGILSINDFAQQSDQQKIASAVKVKFLPDGSIVCAGRIGRTVLNPLANGPMYLTRTGPLVTRFNPDLTLDTTFAGTGYVKMPSTVASQFSALDVSPDGSIIAGLQTFSDIRLYKYLPNGDADPAFGTAGLQVINTGANNNVIRDIKILADGKILISGSKTGNSRDAFIARLMANGALDQAYGSGGIMVFPNDSGQQESAVQTLALDNGMTLTGLQKWGSNFDFQSVFTTPTGSVAASMANEGWLLAPMADNERLTCMMQQPDGKIVMAGYNENNCILMRYDIASILGSSTFNSPVLTVYPNPATDHVIIKGIPENTLVILYSISGQKVLEVISTENTQIDISSLAKGIYFLKTADGTSKIIKE